ncbi:MAG: thioredoxin family protein [Thomasclavelia sp.]|jgi:glutaredoxin|nr:thioredoxin family protein [Thomasclavelia sp.]
MLKMFILENCPHCKLARKCLKELQEEDKYKDIKIEMIDEGLNPEVANQYDYYYVPTFFNDDKKLFEGHMEKEDVKKVLDEYLAGK